MALVCRPALLIADEPTTALDVTIQAQILKLLKDLQQDLGMAILLITHDLGVVANMADEVVVMYRGRVMESGTREDIFRRPEHPYLKALLHAVPRFDMKPGEKLVPLRDIKTDIGSMMRKGADISNARVANKGPAPGAIDRRAPVLSVRNLRKSYTIRKSGFLGAGKPQSVLAVDDVSFDVFRGECLGLVGESGCGKTTVSKMVMRALLAGRSMRTRETEAFFSLAFRYSRTLMSSASMPAKSLLEAYQRLAQLRLTDRRNPVGWIFCPISS
jgi:peptide/nickel transport system ATP-binding protein